MKRGRSLKVDCPPRRPMQGGRPEPVVEVAATHPARRPSRRRSRSSADAPPMNARQGSMRSQQARSGQVRWMHFLTAGRKASEIARLRRAHPPVSYPAGARFRRRWPSMPWALTFCDGPLPAFDQSERQTARELSPQKKVRRCTPSKASAWPSSVISQIGRESRKNAPALRQ